MKITFLLPKKDQVFEILCSLVILSAVLWAIYFSFATILIPYQIEFREGAAQMMTDIILKGGNPFIYDNQPLGMNNYGIGYGIVVLPFAALFGNTLAVHRSVTFLFIVISSLVGGVVVYQKNKVIPLALACSSFIMIGLIAHGGIGAFPSSLGTFLFLLAILIPFLRSFNWGSLVLSLLISIMAFYTKPYFVFAFGIICSYLFLFVSKKKGVLYGIAFSGLVILSVLVASRLFPLYIINTVLGNASNAYLDFKNLTAQLRELFLSFYPVLGLLFFFIAARFSQNRTQNVQSNDSLFNVSTWDRPFVNRPFNFWLYSFLCSLLAFLFILGPHIGNYLNYAFQLLIPTFFCWFLSEFSYFGKWKMLVFSVLIFNLFAWEFDFLQPAKLIQRDSQEWAQVFNYLHASSVTLNSPVTTSEIIALGQTPMDSGQTAYFYAVESFSENPLTNTSYDEFYDDGFRYMLLIDRMIEKQRFDLVITTQEKANFYHDRLLWDYYYQVDQIKVEMPQTGQHWTLIFWKPLIK